MKFTNSLHSLTFGFDFNQVLDNVKFPSSLQNITFGMSFNQNVDDVKFPDSLQVVIFNNYYNQTLNEKIKELKIKYLYKPMTNLSPFLEKITF